MFIKKIVSKLSSEYEYRSIINFGTNVTCIPRSGSIYCMKRSQKQFAEPTTKDFQILRLQKT